MARNYDETRVFQMGVNQIADCVRALAMSGNGYSQSSESNINMGIQVCLFHKLSMKSYGEKIQVNIVDQSNQTTAVSVQSDNAYPLQMGDMGRNKQNAEEIFEAIATQKYLANPQIQQSLQQQNVQPNPQVQQQNVQPNPPVQQQNIQQSEQPNQQVQQQNVQPNPQAQQQNVQQNYQQNPQAQQQAYQQPLNPAPTRRIRFTPDEQNVLRSGCKTVSFIYLGYAIFCSVCALMFLVFSIVCISDAYYYGASNTLFSIAAFLDFTGVLIAFFIKFAQYRKCAKCVDNDTSIIINKFRNYNMAGGIVLSVFFFWPAILPVILTNVKINSPLKQMIAGL